MHMAKGTIVSLFTVFSAYISSVQCREATSGNRVEEAGVDLGGGVTIYINMYIGVMDLIPGWSGKPVRCGSDLG